MSRPSITSASHYGLRLLTGKQNSAGDGMEVKQVANKKKNKLLLGKKNKQNKQVKKKQQKKQANEKSRGMTWLKHITLKMLKILKETFENKELIRVK